MRLTAAFVVFLSTHCVCERSHVTKIINSTSIGTMLECPVDTHYINGIVTWDILYEDDTRDRYTCMKPSIGKTIECSFYSIRYNIVECFCSYDIIFRIYVILREVKTSLHICHIENKNMILRKFFVVPDTSISVGYRGISIREVSCCIDARNMMASVSTIRDGHVVQHSEPCSNKRCFISLWKISGHEPVTQYECNIKLTMWNITVVKKNYATIVGSDIVPMSANRTEHRHNGSCVGRVAWIMHECSMIGTPCNFSYQWHVYKSDNRIDMEPLIYVYDSGIRRSTYVFISIKSGPCIRNVSTVRVTLNLRNMHFKIMASVFADGDNIMVYETRIINIIDVHIDNIKNRSYVKCINPRGLKHFRIRALPGCHGSEINVHKKIEMENVRYDRYGCIATDEYCNAGALWTVQNNSVTGPIIIENMTSYVKQNGHCAQAHSSGTSIEINMYTLLSMIFYIQTQ